MNLKMKTIVCLICILLVNITTVNSSTHLKMDNENYNLTNINTFVDVDIVDIFDGIGIDIIIKNNGNIDIENILLEIEIDDNTIILPKQYEISYLTAGDSTSIHITIFGFNIGLIRDFSKISMILRNVESVILEGQITASIIGPIVSIISIYFTNDGNDVGYILYCPMSGYISDWI